MLKLFKNKVFEYSVSNVMVKIVEKRGFLIFFDKIEADSVVVSLFGTLKFFDLNSIINKIIEICIFCLSF